jgi:hypothetical protein
MRFLKYRNIDVRVPCKTPSKSLKDWAQCLRQLSFKNRLRPTGITISYIHVGGRDREGRILKRTVIDPTQHDGLWDALVSEFEAMPWGDVLELLGDASLRALLDRIKKPLDLEDVVGRLLKEAADAEAGRRRTRRAVVDRIALRDQPILNKFQGEIFRLPLDRQVILLGPPGSGKTTTLIRRLAQKRTPDALTEDEQSLPSQSSPVACCQLGSRATP